MTVSGTHNALKGTGYHSLMLGYTSSYAKLSAVEWQRESTRRKPLTNPKPLATYLYEKDREEARYVFFGFLNAI